MFDALRISRLVTRCLARAPRSLSPLIAPAVALALLAVACGDDEGIRVVANAGTADANGTAEGTGTGAPTPTSEATGTPVPVPDLPEDPFAGGRLVEEYLAGGDADLELCLPDLVARWEMASAVAGDRCVLADFDGDRADEYAFLVSFGSGEDDASPYPADLWFFQDADAGYRFFNSARGLANAETPGLQVRLVEDLTSDGHPDLVMTWLECGAHTCVTHLTIASDHNGGLEDLAPEDASIESLEAFTFEDGEIRLAGGLVGSVGAGPQRESTLVIRWAGSQFRSETEPGEPTYLVHLVNDADRLFEAGEYADARDAYLGAATNSALPDWKAEVGEEPGRAELQAYSIFRAGLASLRLDDATEARSLLRQAASEHPQTMHGAAAQEYLQELEDGDSPAKACEGVEVLLDEYRELYASFWNYGYANPSRTVFTLCR